MQTLYIANGEYTSKRGNHHQQRIRQKSTQQRELSDIQLIKYISRNTNRHGTKPRPRRRPKPVYGPPDYIQGTPIGPPQKPIRPNYGPPKTKYIDQEQPPLSVSYFPSNDYDASQNQHNSFAEPPPVPTRPEIEEDASLPIQSDSSAYRLPPSTSYGTPVSPIINVYPDKLEYMKNNQPASSLYNIFNSVPALIPQTTFQPPLPNPPPVFNFAEPTFNSSLHTYNLPSGYYTGKDPYLSVGSIGEISEESSSSQFNLDEEDEFSAEASSEYEKPRPAINQNVRRPASHHSLFHAPSDQYVDDLLVFPKEPLGSSSSNVNAQSTSPFINNFNHNLDTEDLREHYSAGTEQRPIKTHKRSKRRKHPKPVETAKPAEFGTRIGFAKSTAAPTSTSSTTIPTPVNFVLLSAANHKPYIEDDEESYEQSNEQLTTDTATSQERSVFARVSKYHQSHNNGDKNESISTESKLHPQHRDTYASADDEPLLRSTTTSHPLAESQRGKNFEIVSIDRSQSHSYYAGTVAPAVATNHDNAMAAAADQSSGILAERILSDVIAAIRV